MMQYQMLVNATYYNLSSSQ